MRREITAAVLLALALSACTRSGRKPAGVPPPSGSGVWFADGLRSIPAEREAEAGLSRRGFSWVLLPAARVERREGRWTIVRLTPPPRPFRRAVSLVIEGGQAGAALADAKPEARRALAGAVALAVRTAIRDGPRFGPVAGVHLDIPFRPETAPAYGALLDALRRELPRGSFLTISLDFDPPPSARGKFLTLAAKADGIVGMIFGEDERADPATLDSLRRPWWTGYAPNADGRWTGRNGQDRGRVPEWILSELSDDPHLEFHHDMEIEERAGFGYVFRPHRTLTLDGWTFSSGDTIEFLQPFLSDLVRDLGNDLAGRRSCRGRVFRLSGQSDSQRIFTMAALDEILAGRPLDPKLVASVARDETSVTVAAENRSPLPSALSRLNNWVEVELPRPGVRDVRPGGFDRYEVYAANGRRVSLGRAARVRFFETLLGPSEKIEPAVIRTGRPIPPGCCRLRVHVLSAAGREIAGDWQPTGGSGNGKR
jgi:hypothetical protein